MRRSIVCTVTALAGLLPVLPKQALGQPVEIANTGWAAESSAGPAVVAVGGAPFAAWKGKSSQQIWYSSSGLCGGLGCSEPGGWSTQQKVPNALSTAAPALATVGPYPFMAWKGSSTPAASIQYSIMAGSALPASDMNWTPVTPVCDATGNCPQTIAAPALTSTGYTVYMAWTTSADTIMLATYTATGGTPYGTNGAWSIAAAPVPGAFTTNAPALALYNGALFLAWVAEGSNQVNYASLSLLAGSWTTPVAVSGLGWNAETDVSPAFGIFSVPTTKPTEVIGGLYLSWITPTVNETDAIDFAYWNDSGWSEWNPPIPIPPGPLTIDTPALVGIAVPALMACDPTYYYFSIAFTGLEQNVYTDLLETVLTPPKSKSGGTTCQ